MDILNNAVIPYLYGIENINKYWFIENGAKLHGTQKTFCLLVEHFQNIIIVLDSGTESDKFKSLTLYFPDLNPCELFSWGHIKDKVYRTQPSTEDDLEIAISREILEI